MKTLIKWLDLNGIKYRAVTMTDGKAGVMIDTNYDGPYPTAATRKLHSDINNKIRRLKGLKAESRGFDTAVLVVNM